jgi:enamine deaminase RidA (YjgF/YER057c/UK114 family)
LFPKEKALPLRPFNQKTIQKTMKKVLSTLFVAGMIALVACGPSAEEKAAQEKAAQDSIAAAEAAAKAAAEQAVMQDSAAAAAATVVDSAAAAVESAK